MKRISLLGLLMLAILSGCTATPHSPPSAANDSAGSVTVTTSRGATTSSIPAGSVTVATSRGAIDSSTLPEVVSPRLRGVHWVLTSLRQGRTVTDVRTFTPVVLELTTNHFTMDTGVSANLFHYAGGPKSLVLGSRPPYEVGHAGYVGNLGPAPQILYAVLQTTKILE